MWKWLKTNKDQLDVLSGLAGVVATGLGLYYAATQIRSASDNLEAQTLYNIQKDARELFKDVSQDENYVDYVLNFDEHRPYQEDAKKLARRKIGLILQFYATTHNQRRLNSMSEDSWRIVRDDLCAYITRPPIPAEWKTYFVRAAFSAEFKQAVAQCGERK